MATVVFFACAAIYAQAEVCPRPAAGSVADPPAEIRSKNGVLQATLSLQKAVGANGEVRYCYIDENGDESPTLRVKPGDQVLLKLKNDLPVSSASGQMAHAAASLCISGPMSGTKLSGLMNASSTNLHFHGLALPPICTQDDVLRTNISPGSKGFVYRFRIPRDQPPGLYWYHPHPHGHSEEQVLGGASGALIVEGIERYNGALAGLPERLLVIRDQVRINSGVAPKPPSKDLSVNFVPVPYPDYPAATLKIKPRQRELWRVLNASADTFAELHLLINGKWQPMGLVSVDGVPLHYPLQPPQTGGSDQIDWVESILIPSGGRAEFLYDSPPEGGRTQVLTAGVDTVPLVDEDDPAFAGAANKPVVDDDDYTPPRWLLTLSSTPDAPEPSSFLPKAISSKTVAKKPVQSSGTQLTSIKPTRTRKLYFSEKVMDPSSPRTSTVFYVTEEGKDPAAFDPSAAPNITVHQGEVEDWIIENHSQEAHTFHIHQTHFVVRERDNRAVDENYLRDTVAIPYWDGTTAYPSVKLRIDFRSPTTVGTFPYHCHILQHEDGGMMGTVQVLKRDTKSSAGAKSTSAKMPVQTSFQPQDFTGAK
jgi:FtsP/CotA-like multicopper oxidase with cupredoxin domain